MSFALDHSPLESARFNINAGKLNISDSEDVKLIVPKMKELGLNFVSTRVDAGNLPLMQKLEQLGFYLTDTLVGYKGALPANGGERPATTPRLAETKDHEQIIRISQMAFENYLGHYHSDPKLDRKKADEVYKDWAYKSCKDNFLTDAIFVTEDAGRITSFITIKKNDTTSQGILAGVLPEYQTKGLYKDLIRAMKIWSVENGCTHFMFTTQITNMAVQKVWVREGCSFFQASYTLHFWLND